MNRRMFLTALSGGTFSTLTGCTALTDSGDASSKSSDSDSDLDGVPDRSDYAPWDKAVQNKSDVIDEYWGVTLSPEDESTSGSAVRSMFDRSSPEVARSISVHPGKNAPQSMSLFTKYSRDGATLKLRPGDTPSSPYRVLLVAREFPRRDIVTTAQSESLAPEDTDVTVTFESSLESSETLHISAFTMPDSTPRTASMSDLVFLHETSPFEIKTSGLKRVDTEYSLEDIRGESYSRVRVEGGYAITLSGRTLGNQWILSYFASQSAYEAKRMTSRGRSRDEYARYALSNGTGEHFVEILQNGARQAGFTTQREQAKFTIDVVQGLPYVLDSVGSGFDDYSKFVEETMVDLRGDCEDSTIALGVFLSELGYEVVLVEFSNHIGLGIGGNHEGSYIRYNTQQYYYLETTSPGWSIGDLPRDLDTSDVRVSII